MLPLWVLLRFTRMSAEPTVLNRRWTAAMSLGVTMGPVLIYRPSKVKHSAAGARSEIYVQAPLTLEKET
jgi:hypothetical protein